MKKGKTRQPQTRKKNPFIKTRQLFPEGQVFRVLTSYVQISEVGNSREEEEKGPRDDVGKNLLRLLTKDKQAQLQALRGFQGEESKLTNGKKAEADERSYEENNASMRRLVGKEVENSIDAMAAQLEAFENSNQVDQQQDEMENSDSKTELKKAVKSAYSRKAKKRF